MMQSRFNGLPQLSFIGLIDHQIGHGQFNGVFLITVQTGPRLRFDKLAINPKVGKSFATGPLGQVGVETFSGAH